MGTIMKKRIYYHDTDCGGVVYYANYLKYFEEARTELLRSKGIDLKALASERLLFAVKRVEIDYKGPARYGDELEVATEVSKVKNASLEFLQTIKRKDILLVSAKTILVCIDGQFKPCVIPDQISERLAR